jgi:putative ABC transport system permease protein
LGIILATTTLIAVMSVINGMNVYVADNVSRMGADGFSIRRIVMMGWDPKKYLEMLRRNPILTKEEFRFLKSRASLVRELGIEAGRGVDVHVGKETMLQVFLEGVTANHGVIANWEPAEGRMFTEIEDQRRVPVAFIGSDLKDKFFKGTTAVGKTVTADGVVYQVVGVAKAKGSVFGHSQDNVLFIPADTYFKIYGTRGGMGYNAVAIDHAHLDQSAEEIKLLLRAYRHLKPKDDDTFNIVTSASLVSFWEQLTGAIAATAVGVVSVFMVVGGVVIMNIMLAVVTERTHEIGIRKSVGARHRDILNQFLVESSMLAATGGFIGVLLAWIAAVIIRNATPVPMELPVSAVIVGVGVSAIVGLFFGIYPARKAAKLDPIEALRMEK